MSPAGGWQGQVRCKVHHTAAVCSRKPAETLICHAMAADLLQRGVPVEEWIMTDRDASPGVGIKTGPTIPLGHIGVSRWCRRDSGRDLVAQAIERPDAWHCRNVRYDVG